MYRISFDTTKGRWVIELQQFGIFWATIKLEGQPCSWEDYDAALTYVEKIGLAKVYRDYRTTVGASILNSQVQRSY
jgi:hypothetical protein